jgi:Na+/H+ antiporter NhaC
MRVMIVAAFVLILGALAAAGVFMMRDGRQGEKNKRMARALALRVGLSVLLFVCILVAYWMGWIAPTGIPVNR